jgi:hypothetical protein
VLDVGIGAITGNKCADVTAVVPNPGGIPYTEISSMVESLPIPPASST